ALEIACQPGDGVRVDGGDAPTPETREQYEVEPRAVVALRPLPQARRLRLEPRLGQLPIRGLARQDHRLALGRSVAQLGLLREAVALGGASGHVLALEEDGVGARTVCALAVGDAAVTCGVPFERIGRYSRRRHGAST